MAITPIDIKKMGFKSSFSGYNKIDVSAYLEVVSDEFTKLIAENESLKKDKAFLQDKVQDQEKIRTSLENAAKIITSTVDDIKVKTEQEAELIINQAKLKADEIISSAHKSSIDMVDKIEELKKEKSLLIKKMKSFISIHSEILETFEDDTADKA